MTGEINAKSYEEEFAPILEERLKKEDFHEILDAVTKLTVGLAVYTKDEKEDEYRECADLLKEVCIQLVSKRINSYVNDITADNPSETMDEGRLHTNLTMIEKSVTRELIGVAGACADSGELSKEKTDEFNFRFRIFLTEYMFLSQIKLDWYLMRNSETAQAFFDSVTSGYKLPQNIKDTLKDACKSVAKGESDSIQNLQDSLPSKILKEIHSILGKNENVGSVFSTPFYAVLSSVKNIFYSCQAAIISCRNELLKNMNEESKNRAEEAFEELSSGYAHIADVMFSSILDLLIKMAEVPEDESAEEAQAE